MSATLLNQALAHHQSGRLSHAQSVYQQILRLNPEHSDALHLLGLTHLQSGDPTTAVELIRRAVTLQPANPAYRGNLGVALIEAGQPRDALAEISRAAQLDSTDPQYAMGVANCHALCGNHAAAERQFAEVTARFPDYPLAWLNRGNFVRDQGRGEEALSHYEHAIALDASLADAHNNLGSVMHRMGKLVDAEAAYRRALAIDPHNPLTRCNLASILIDRGAFAEAEMVCRAVTADVPTLPVGFSFLGAALGHQGRLEEALACYQRALELDPANVSTITAIGATLQEIGRMDEALPWLRKAAESAPEDAPIQQVLSTTLLAEGLFQEGWQRYVFREARLHFTRKYANQPLHTRFDSDVQGREIVLLREQGLGDELFFLRYVQPLAAHGARIVYRSSSKIAGMLRRAGDIRDVITEDTPFAPDREHLLIGDLPLAVGLLEQSSNAGHWPPAPPPLELPPLPDMVSRMRERLADAGPPPYVALTWRAGTPPAQQQGSAWLLSKEIGLAALGQALAEGNTTLIAIQRNPAANELNLLAKACGRPVHDFCAVNDDLEAMLALLSLVDDYVGVSNTNMHLRAGLRLPARVLVPRPAEWRWMTQGACSTWFPNFTIYRQNANGDWGQSLTALARDIAKTPRG